MEKKLLILTEDQVQLALDLVNVGLRATGLAMVSLGDTVEVQARKAQLESLRATLFMAQESPYESFEVML